MTPLLLLLSLPFAGDLTALGHADYRTREAATARLRAAMPWSLPALLAPAGPDAESRIRRRSVAEPWLDRYAGRLWRVPARWWIADALIFGEFPTAATGVGALPWEDFAVHRAFGRDAAVKRSVLQYATRCGLTRCDEVYAFDPDLFPAETTLSGLSEFRFRARGIPGPSEWLTRGATLNELARRYAPGGKERP